MTELAYEVTRGGLVTDRVDRQQARELYERAAADPASELVGELGPGFAYWVVNPHGLKLVRVRVEPVAQEIDAIP